MRRMLVALLAATAVTAHAQTFPGDLRPVRIVVPFAPGGQTDIQARAIAARMKEQSGISVYVDNRPGGATLIGAREVQKSAPDGHTLLYTIATHVQLPHLFREPPWDPFKNFTPITTGARSATILSAHVSLPFKTVKELVAYAKANPGKLSYASFAAGSTAHLNAELFKRLAGIDLMHVPYKGSGDAMKDHISGHVDLFFDGATTAIANANARRVKLLATAAESRIAAIPDVPTMRESGYDVGLWGYLWFWGPANMPTATVNAVYGHLAKAVQHPSMKELFAKGGAESIALSPAETARVARDLDRRWGKVIRELNIKLDN